MIFRVHPVKGVGRRVDISAGYNVAETGRSSMSCHAIEKIVPPKVVEKSRV